MISTWLWGEPDDRIWRAWDKTGRKDHFAGHKFECACYVTHCARSLSHSDRVGCIDGVRQDFYIAKGIYASRLKLGRLCWPKSDALVNRNQIRNYRQRL